MIRVALLDEHAAVRCGLDVIVAAEPGIVTVGAAAGGHELWPLLYRADPDVLVVGRPGDDDPLVVCLRARTRFPRTRLVLYTEGEDVSVPARFAGVDAVVDRSADPRELIEAVRGERELPEVRVGAQRRAAARLEPRDRAILAMRLAGTTPSEIAATVGMTRVQLARRFARIVALLRAAAPRSLAPI